VKKVGESESGVPIIFGHRFWLAAIVRLERRCGVEVMHVYGFMDTVFKNLDPIPREGVYDCEIEKCV
jgi:hypothetical protein